ncbi:MAG TPA: alanine racemase, partial [Kofleriaceae bacterium]|nr:alanine racemase [Kofleriaceae bacterium]
MSSFVSSSTMIRRTRVEVDLSAIVENAGALTALTGTNVYAVVKADGYGHGAVAVARALAATSAVAGFAVSLVEEAVVLRDAGIAAPILVMGPSQLGGEDELLGLALTPVVSDAEEVAALAALARRRNVT